MARLRVLVSVFAALGMLFITQQAISQEKQEEGVPAQYRIVVGEDRSVKIYDLQENLLVHHKAKEQKDKEVVPEEENPAPGIESLPKGPDLKPQPDSLLKSIETPEEEEDPAPSIESLPKGPDLKPQVNAPHSSKGFIPKSTSDSPNLTSYTGSGSNNTLSFNSSTCVITFNGSVQNNGTGPAGSFRVGWYLSDNTTITTGDHLICYATQSSLSIDHYVNKSCTKDLDDLCVPANTYYAGEIIDYQNTVNESNENDNTSHWSTPKITIKPNLCPYTGSGSDNTLGYDSSSHVCIFNTSVVNDGDACAGSFRVGWYLSTNTTISTSDHLITYATESGLCPGYYVTKSGSKDLDDVSGLPAGTPVTYYVGCYIDYQETVSETNENDNTFYWTDARITWPPYNPNLYLYTGSGSDNTFNYSTYSHVCTFKTSVANDGDISAGSFRVGWYLSIDTIINTSDPLITFITVSSLNNGSRVNLRTSKDLDNLSLSPGIYCAGIYIDDLKQVREKDENDNTAYWPSPQVTWPPGVSVWIPIGLTCGCGNGDTFVAPVRVDDVTGDSIYSYGLEVTYNSSDLVATGATSTGCITSGWGAPTVSTTPGKITIGSAGSTVLSGSGDLVKINFRSLKAHTNGQTVSLHLQNVEFNEGTPCATTSDGLLTFQPDIAKITGAVKYFQDSRPIPNVTVRLTGGATENTTTDNSGNYRFTDLSSDNYTVTSDKTNAQKSSAVGPYDASYVLRHYVGSLSLTPWQKIAADVTGNGEVSTFDASYILRYYVCSIDHFPAGDWRFVPTSFSLTASNWSTAESSRSYTPLNSDQTDQDFKGVLYGDVTGNWSASISAAKPLVDYELLSKVGFEDISGIAGEEVTLPIVVTDISNLYSAGMVLEYDPELLRVIQVKTTDLSEDCIIASNDMGGQLRIALAGAQAVKGSGSLVDVIFKVSHDAKTGQSSSVRLARFHLNDLRSTALRKEVSFTVGSEMPATYNLSQSYPNPFNLETQIRYSLAKTGHVTLSIYSILGQRVRTLIDGTQEAGSYQVIWDGRDEKGEILSSGVYFLNMTAGEFKQTQKILLIK